MAHTGKRPKAGVIGLGRMGSALADALIAKGFQITVWNRTSGRAERLAKAGARVATSVTDAANASDILIVCVLDHAAAMEVLDTVPVAKALRGKTLVHLSTMTSAQSQALDRWGISNGIDYLDGQILNYPEEVRAGTARTFYSGPSHLFEAHRVILEAMGGRAYLVAETVGAAPAYDKAYLACWMGIWVSLYVGAAICRMSGVPCRCIVMMFGPLSVVRLSAVSSNRRCR